MQTTFEALWTREIHLLDEPNNRRGYLSMVGTVSAENQQDVLFVKKQHRKSGRLNWKRPSLRREHKNLRCLQQAGFIVPEEVLYAESKHRYILITKALAGFVDLPTFMDMGLSPQALNNMAKTIRQLHDAHWQYQALYPKHIFIHPKTLQVALIDCETARRRLSKRRCRLRDLDSLNRRFDNSSLRLRWKFLLAYCDDRQSARKLWQQLADKQARKARRAI